MKVIIAGSRGITDYKILLGCIDYSRFEITEIVTGMARGVDILGWRYGKENNIPIKEFRPDWNKTGKRAGILRNEQMGMYADALIAIWDGQSAGTKHMINYMKKLGKPVEVLEKCSCCEGWCHTHEPCNCAYELEPCKGKCRS